MSRSPFVSNSHARLLRAAGQNYDSQDWNAVSRFLDDNPYLIPVLNEAYSAIETVFGAGARVELEVTTDPEIADLVKLFGYIMTGLPVTEAFSKLNEFDDTWFLDNLSRAKGKLNFDLR